MNRTNLIILLFILLTFSCKNKVEETPKSTGETFGKTIDASSAIAGGDLLSSYNELGTGDTLNVNLTAEVLEVCPKKGCWMKLKLNEEETVFVKFKDYGFFVPKDIAGSQVVVEGKAFVDETSVEDQKHYAEDAGKSEEEIAMINEPVKSYSFVADGVLLKK